MERHLIYVSNIPKEVIRSDIVTLFGFCGRLKGCVVGPSEFDDNLQEALVEFVDASSVPTALTLSGTRLQDSEIEVTTYKPGQEKPTIRTSSSDIKVEPTPEDQESTGSSPQATSPPEYVLLTDPRKENKNEQGNKIAVYVSNIAPSATEADLRQFFQFCGRVVNITLNPSPSGTKFAIIEFAERKVIDTAVLLNGAIIRGTAVQVVPYHDVDETDTEKRPKKLLPRYYSSSKTIHIADVDPTISNEEFISYFEFCGPISRYAIDRNAGFAMLEYEEEQATHITHHLDKGFLGNKAINITQMSSFNGDADVIRNLEHTFAKPVRVPEPDVQQTTYVESSSYETPSPLENMPQRSAPQVPPQGGDGAPPPLPRRDYNT